MTTTFFKYIFIVSVATWVMLSCTKQTTPEAFDLQPPKVGTPEYYLNLEAYKKSDHGIAFGWFGGWTAQGPSKSKYLASTPDSMDIISIWGGWSNLTPEQIADMRYVQQKKKTRITFTVIAHQIGDGINGDRKFWPADDSTAIVTYARAIVDTVNKYGYDGFDIDYEPDFCGCAVFLKNNNMRIFVKELGKYLGPKSGTGKLLLCDGGYYGPVTNRSMPLELLEYINYWMEQAYGANNTGLATRLAAFPKGFPSKKFVVNENFESLWQGGGNLLTMASWNPAGGRKGGIGTYHMEYEYPNEPDYKFMRRAIQIMNPAPY
ncbi:MAG TPA: endo-beta-N-acetylglucosaminidase family protein [Chitinophaga sp.]|uniref:endo-beta-N-acetylglucosaminidase family protein n=1 Tax=Chitinophaga sp. TaxID=1869181 RepID=UPI002BD9D89E|nr:endo-beta-N-acetylglucosaminidase family protein [Chitinophaga sp.]HVI45638.1 endo-beta-N-acetylglucosaminidase family protein [Chitinophaga sp.]